MCTIQELFYDKAKSFVLAYFSVHHLSTSVYKTKQTFVTRLCLRSKPVVSKSNLKVIISQVSDSYRTRHVTVYLLCCNNVYKLGC